MKRTLCVKYIVTGPAENKFHSEESCTFFVLFLKKTGAKTARSKLVLCCLIGRLSVLGVYNFALHG